MGLRKGGKGCYEGEGVGTCGCVGESRRGGSNGVWDVERGDEHRRVCRCMMEGASSGCGRRGFWKIEAWDVSGRGAKCRSWVLEDAENGKAPIPL